MNFEFLMNRFEVYVCACCVCVVRTCDWVAVTIHSCTVDIADLGHAVLVGLRKY